MTHTHTKPTKQSKQEERNQREDREEEEREGERMGVKKKIKTKNVVIFENIYIYISHHRSSILCAMSRLIYI